VILKLVGIDNINQFIQDVLQDILWFGGANVTIAMAFLGLYWCYYIFEMAQLENLEMDGDGVYTSRRDFIYDSEISDLKMENDELNGAEVQASGPESLRDDFIWEEEMSELRMENESLNDSEAPPAYHDDQPLDTYGDSPEMSGLEEPEFA